MHIMDIYNKLPIALQNAACHYGALFTHRTHYGELFHRLLAEYMERKSWNYSRLSQFRNQRLMKMMKHCYETVPYYTDMFDKYGINYRQIQTLEDLKVLPTLNKHIVRQNYDKLISTAIAKKRMIQKSTGGTTGSSFVFHSTREAGIEQNALWWSYYQNIGIPYGAWCGRFGYSQFIPVKQTSPPFWRVCAPRKSITFSSFHVSENNMKYYFEEINRRRLTWLHGFPSLLTLLAAYMLERGLQFDAPLTHVTLGSEKVHGYQKDIMRKGFGLIPWQHYGMMEDVANFSENKDHNMYVDEDFAAMEFLPNAYGRYSVIGTSLTNFAMPLLRWEMNDNVLFEVEADGKRRITALDGRVEDIVSLPDGRKIGRLDHVFREITNFKEVQIYQHKDYSITVYAVKITDDISRDEKISLAKLRGSVGEALDIRFKYVDQIPRTQRNKLQFVISEIR